MHAFALFQVDNIAPMFGLDPTRPLWIVRKNGNIAVWPRGGLFSGPLVVAGAMYDMKGHGIEANHPTARTENAAGPSSPFGLYAFPTYSTSPFAQAPHPPAKKKKGFGKTIIVVSLKRKSGSVALKGNTPKAGVRDSDAGHSTTGFVHLQCAKGH